MKRGIWNVMLVMLAVCMCACGKSSDKAPAETQAPVATEMPTSDVVSSPAVKEDEQTQISDTEAFKLAEELLAKMTLEEKIGQMFMLHLSELDDSHTEDGNQYEVTDAMRDILSEYNIGGIYLTQNNIANKQQAKELTKDLQSCVSGGAMYVAVEEEGGGSHSVSSKVDELKEGGIHTPLDMSRELSEEQVYEKAKKIASELTSIGINFNLAPVADVGTKENKDYAKRCFGTELKLCESMIENFVSGMREEGISVTLKYFPGIGNVSGEYYMDLLENTDNLMTLRDDNFSLYSAGIKAGADAVMVSNVSVAKVTLSDIPAFMSPEIVTSLLRDELGFEGVVMTPFLDDKMIKDRYTPGFVAVEAVKAGCDILVLPENWKESYDALKKAVERGEITEKVINTAVQRILKNKIRRGILVLENKKPIK